MVDSDEEERFVWQKPEFQIWLMNGIRNKWITAPNCLVHQFVPLTEEEKSLINNGDVDELCVYSMRIIATPDQGEDIGKASEDPFYEIDKYIIWQPEIEDDYE